MTNFIQSLVLQKVPIGKSNAGGWISFNAPCCTHNGQARPDKRKRGGVQLDGSGLRYSCFNCGYKTGWQPGQLLSAKLKNLLKWLGTSKEELAQANFEALKIKESNNFEKTEQVKGDFNYHKIDLPKNSKNINEWAKETNPPEKFIQALQYLATRNFNYIKWFNDFYWSPELADRLIIPMLYKDGVYGWSARLTRKQKAKAEPKYKMNEGQTKFLFGADRLFDEHRKYVIITEGIFDAIAVSGVATSGNELTGTQIKWINDSNKKVIVLADKDTAGQKLIDVALKQNWLVSFPDLFNTNVKDAADAVNVYGRLMVIKAILDAAEDSPLKINLLRKSWK